MYVFSSDEFVGFLGKGLIGADDLFRSKQGIHSRHPYVAIDTPHSLLSQVIDLLCWLKP